MCNFLFLFVYLFLLLCVINMSLFSKNAYYFWDFLKNIFLTDSLPTSFSHLFILCDTPISFPSIAYFFLFYYLLLAFFLYKFLHLPTHFTKFEAFVFFHYSSVFLSSSATSTIFPSKVNQPRVDNEGSKHRFRRCVSKTNY